MTETTKERLQLLKAGITPQGYTETDGGIFPDDWRIIQLSEAVRVFRGASPRPKGDPKYYGGNIPRLLIEDVSRDGKYVVPAVDSLTEEGAKKSRYVPKGTVVLSCSGTRVAIPGILSVPACIHDGFFGFDDYKNLLPEYLYYYFELLHEKMQSSATKGGVFNNLTTQIMKEMYIQLPCVNEQEKNVETITIWDKAIELKERLIEQKKEQKKGLMQKLLTGKSRLPGFEGEWKEVTIGDIGTLKGGSAFPEKYQNSVEGKYPFFKVSDMNLEQNYKYMIVANNNINDEIRSKIKANVIPSGSIVFAKVGAALLLERKKILSGDACIDNNLMALTVNKEYDYNFMYYLLHSIKLSKVSNTGALPSLNAKDICSIKVNIPKDQEEQRKIGDFFTLVDKEIRLLVNETSELKLQKYGLMQLLLTGKVRVKV